VKKLLLILFFIPALAYPGTTGKLTGKVTDAQTGEPLIGVNVLIEGTTLGAAADADGSYVILNVPPGIYNVKFSSIGYKTSVIQDVKIITDQTTIVNLQMESGSVEMGEIIVSAKTPLVQKDLTSSISVMTRDEIDALPVASFTELLSMQAGVVGSGSSLHIRGGRSNEVAFMVDGMYVSDPLLGGLTTGINNDAIQEMSMLSGTFNAEYGNALSGIVNIVTRDGSDELSGKAEYRTSEFGIEEYDKFHEMRANGSLSGPLFTKSVKFFVSAEQIKEGSYLSFGYNKEQTVFSKLTVNAIPNIKFILSNRGSFTARKSYSHAFKYIPDFASKRESDSYQAMFGATHTAANNFFYEIKTSYFNQGYFSGYDRDTSKYISINDEQYLITTESGKDYLDFYSKATSNSIINSRSATADARLDATWQMGKINEVKFGVQYKKHWLKLFKVDGVKNPLHLQYIDNYKTDKPYEIASYIQDKIEFQSLVVNLGLRFDYMDANVQFRDDPLDQASVTKVKARSQISPRVGIAHPITDRTKLHFSYGHFFQNPDYQYLFENKDYKSTVREPIFGQPSLDAERTTAYEIGITHQLNDRTAFSFTAYYKDITGLIGTRYYFPYVDGRYLGYTLYVNEDYANVKGFEVNIDIRPDKYFSGGLTYTYSSAKGSASSETEQYPGTSESTQLYYLDFDKTHVFNASAVFTIPEGEGPVLFGSHLLENVDLSLVFRLGSGYPYTPSGRDVGFVDKNSLRQPSTYTLDVELGKEVVLPMGIKARIFAEALNVTNHKNVTYVYPDTGDPDYTFEGAVSKEYMQDPSNYGPPRTIRIGMGIRF
jgi:outer membrane receptor protein involved in Fe transport